MKKVLSLVLVAVLAIGMGSVAFASDNNLLWDDYDYENIDGFATGRSLIDGIEAASDVKLTTRNTYNNNTTSYVGTADMGTRAPGDKPKLEINLWTFLFNYYKQGDSTTPYYYAVDLDRMYSAGALSWNGSWNYTNTANITDWDHLMAVLATSTNYSYEDTADHPNATPAPAGTPNKISPTSPYDLDYISYTSSSNYASPAANASAILNVYNRAGFVKTTSDTKDALIFKSEYSTNHNIVGAGAGSWTGSDVVYKTEKGTNNRRLTSTEIQKSRIQVASTVQGDSGLVKSLEIDRTAGKIVFKPIDEFVSTSSEDLEVLIYLQIDGKRYDDYGVRVLVELENPIITVYGSHNYVDLSYGHVAEAVEFNSSIAVYLGNGVTIHTKFFKDKKYYGIAKRDKDQEDDRVFTQYKEVDNVLTLKTVGLNSVGDYITLDNDYADYYVYDKDMNYLGRGNENLDFSNKLYLAYNRIEVEEDEEEVEETEPTAPVPTTPDNPDTGGNGQAANNANMNPGTGR